MPRGRRGGAGSGAPAAAPGSGLDAAIAAARAADGAALRGARRPVFGPQAADEGLGGADLGGPRGVRPGGTLASSGCGAAAERRRAAAAAVGGPRRPAGGEGRQGLPWPGRALLRRLLGLHRGRLRLAPRLRRRHGPQGRPRDAAEVGRRRPLRAGRRHLGLCTVSVLLRHHLLRRDRGRPHRYRWRHGAGAGDAPARHPAAGLRGYECHVDPVDILSDCAGLRHGRPRALELRCDILLHSFRGVIRGQVLHRRAGEEVPDDLDHRADPGQHHRVRLEHDERQRHHNLRREGLGV
mmetsp:Transcript_97668/g.304581  ORF Transcript_97668/g.304581 Transcript_97668/m.304581 type:complete len:295 (+) Transcript_97668:599-1483(+)